MSKQSAGLMPRRRLAGAAARGVIALGALCASALLPALAAEPGDRSAARPRSVPPGVAWFGFVPPKAPDYTIAHAFNDYTVRRAGSGR